MHRLVSVAVLLAGLGAMVELAVVLAGLARGGFGGSIWSVLSLLVITGFVGVVAGYLVWTSVQTLRAPTEARVRRVHGLFALVVFLVVYGLADALMDRAHGTYSDAVRLLGPWVAGLASGGVVLAMLRRWALPGHSSGLDDTSKA